MCQQIVDAGGLSFAGGEQFVLTHIQRHLWFIRWRGEHDTPGVESRRLVYPRWRGEHTQSDPVSSRIVYLRWRGEHIIPSVCSLISGLSRWRGEHTKTIFVLKALLLPNKLPTVR